MEILHKEYATCPEASMNGYKMNGMITITMYLVIMKMDGVQVLVLLMLVILTMMRIARLGVLAVVAVGSATLPAALCPAATTTALSSAAAVGVCVLPGHLNNCPLTLGSICLGFELV